MDDHDLLLNLGGDVRVLSSEVHGLQLRMNDKFAERDKALEMFSLQSSHDFEQVRIQLGELMEEIATSRGKGLGTSALMGWIVAIAGVAVAVAAVVIR